MTQSFSKTLVLAASLACAAVVTAPSARADIVFTPGNHPQPDEQNILFSGQESGNPIFGEVGHTGIAVRFQSTTGETLFQNAQGQAQIENAADPGKTPLTSMNVDVPGFGFGDFILNLENGTGTAVVTATDNFNATFKYELGNGQNFLTLTTINNEFITNISVTGTDSTFGFLTFKQPRISQLCALGEEGSCAPVPTPEPASMALLGSALLGFGILRRRKRS